VRFLILSGVVHAEVVRQGGVSIGAVSAIRKELRARMQLYRNRKSTVCVPLPQ
jgi:hypothetical protein